MKEKQGLKPRHHEELNKPPDVWPGGYEARQKRIEEVRKEYAGNKLALEQIDRYDSESPHSKRYRQLRSAYLSGNEKRAQILERWFDIYYPASYKKNKP